MLSSIFSTVLKLKDPSQPPGTNFNAIEIVEFHGEEKSIGGFRGGAEGAAAPLFFSCVFTTFLYDPNPSNRPLSVVIII